ncbi:MAG: hypothetical protein WA003_04130, partial [Desulfuromonadaceae bacterium]
MDIKIIKQIDDMKVCLSEQVRKDLYGAAPFWETLAEKHKKFIKQFGFKRFKRTINFEYNQFSVSSIANEKILSLTWQLLKRLQIPYGG